jgi:hypothetical protein
MLGFLRYGFGNDVDDRAGPPALWPEPGADDGTGPKLFGVSMDVTARKQAEASAAQKRAELEHVARVATIDEPT